MAILLAHFSMGTSRPALYHVLHDEIGFTSDEVEQLTYWVKGFHIC